MMRPVNTTERQMHTLTTADIAAHAGRILAELRARGDRSHSNALATAGHAKALQAAQMMGAWMDAAGHLGTLATLATAHGDNATADRIEADIAATVTRLVNQAAECRHISIHQVAA